MPEFLGRWKLCLLRPGWQEEEKEMLSVVGGGGVENEVFMWDLLPLRSFTPILSLM
jgi:hypothetical protein